MTLTAAESFKDTWQSIFRRRGGDGTYTRLFDHLDPSQQSTLLVMLTLRESELPVIGSVRDVSNWLILTTERLVWSLQGERQEVATDDIYDTTADFRRLVPQRGKLDMKNLNIITRGGDEYLIELEPGQPLSGTWSVLKHLGARNRHAAEKGG